MKAHYLKATLLLLLISFSIQAQNNTQLLVKRWRVTSARHPGNEAQLYNATTAQKNAYYAKVQQMIKGAYLHIKPDNSYIFSFNQQTEKGYWQLVSNTVFSTTSNSGQSQSIIQKLSSKKMELMLQDGTILTFSSSSWTTTNNSLSPESVKKILTGKWKIVGLKNPKAEAKLLYGTSQQKSAYYKQIQKMIKNSRLILRSNGTYYFRFTNREENGNWYVEGNSVLVTDSKRGQPDRSTLTKVTQNEMQLMDNDGTLVTFVPIGRRSKVIVNNTPVTPNPPVVKTNTTDKTPPVVQVTTPKVVTRGFEIVHANKTITVKGVAKDASGIFEVKVNGVEASVQADGTFSANIKLAVGKNNIQVTATDTKNNTATVDFVIERKASVVAKKKVELVDDDFDFDVKKLAKTGKYYALFIAVEQYVDPAISDLDKPVNDAQKLLGTLLSHYTFSKSNITFLKNPKREDIISSLDKLQQTITAKDNLLIFYAGHGHWNSNTNTGYWLPSDAKKSNTANWFRNSTLKDYISGIKSKHTLLIADACFSGGIFKTRNAFSDASQAINKLYELPSRKAMTSGNLQTVPDKSVFLEYLIKRLNSNGKKYISSEQLFSSFRTAVMNNSKNTPRYGDIQDAGDEGGDFIFIRKKK